MPSTELTLIDTEKSTEDDLRSYAGLVDATTTSADAVMLWADEIVLVAVAARGVLDEAARVGVPAGV